MGGDEFVILFPETNYEAAQDMIERLQAKLYELMKKQKWPVTFSIGMVTFKSPPNSVD